MTIPTHYEAMLPILNIMKDQREYKTNQLVESISKQLDLTEEEMNEKVPSGSSRLYDRITWANSYMKHANLIERVDRGIYKITQQGLDVLSENPQKIDLKYLCKFPAFIEWHGKTNSKKDITNDTSSSTKLENYESELENDNVSNKTPIDLIEKGRAELENELQYDLLEKIKSLSDQGFENLVLKLFKKMEYGDPKHTGKSGDHGIDGIIGQDKLGLEKIYVQAKKWQNPVGERELRDFVGSLQAKHTQKGIFITTSNFSPSARQWIRDAHVNVILIQGTMLTELLIQYDVGVSTYETIALKKMDEDYFEEFEM